MGWKNRRTSKRIGTLMIILIGALAIIIPLLATFRPLE